MNINMKKFSGTVMPLSITRACRNASGNHVRSIPSDQPRAGRHHVSGWPSDRGIQSRRHRAADRNEQGRSEEHTSELQSLMRISYAVFCLKKKKNKKTNTQNNNKQINNNKR